MVTTEIDRLNEQFGCGQELIFREGPGGLTVAEIANVHATATIALHGGHVLAYQPTGRKPVLWLSRCSSFEPGKAIRGGIPVCWPWFGAHPQDSAKPSHGFARLRAWEVTRACSADDGATEIDLQLADSDVTRALWSYAFGLKLRVRIGPELRVELVAQNSDTSDVRCTAALHSYFSVGDIAEIAIHGLDGCDYIDTLPRPPAHCTQAGAVRFAGETDYVYQRTSADCIIDDPVLGRRIRIRKRGSRSTVVWNPWAAKAERMPDFGDDEYPGMVCVETANVREDAVTIAPGGEHVLATEISVEGDQ
jgi:glucose-6-phosphate 1-epimerase